MAVYARSMPEHILIFLAVARLGAINVPVNSFWQPDEIQSLLDDAEPVLAVAAAATVDRLVAALPGSSVRTLLVSSVRARPQGAAPPAQCRPFAEVSALVCDPVADDRPGAIGASGDGAGDRA